MWLSLLHHHGSDTTWHPAYPDYISYWLWIMVIWVSKSYRILMTEVEWDSETSNVFNDQYLWQPAKILLNSVAAKGPRHLYSKNVSLKLFNDTQPYLNENALLNWTAPITAIFAENKMTWACSAQASNILQYSYQASTFYIITITPSVSSDPIYLSATLYSLTFTSPIR
jgi:hypothetical protein